MNRYLVAVDYSEVSRNAVQYLLDMSEEQDMIDMLHVKPANTSPSSPPAIHNFLQSDQQTRLSLASYFFNSQTPQNWDITTATGEVVSTIVSAGKNKDYSAIILGTRDKYHLLDKLLGTISLGVVKTSSIPVMVIPPTARFNGLKQVVVAGDSKSTRRESFEVLKSWNSQFNSQLHFVQVGKGEFADFAPIANSIVEDYFEKSEVSFSFDITSDKGRNIPEAIIECAATNQANLIVLFPEKQNLISSILFGSTSKELILKSQFPILFLKV